MNHQRALPAHMAQELMQQTTGLAVRQADELAAMKTVPVVVDARWRTIRVRRYAGPVDRPRSVVLPAALVTLAIYGAPSLVFFLAEAIAK